MMLTGKWAKQSTTDRANQQ